MLPSIEAKHGHPIRRWLDLVVDELSSGTKHMELVALLRSDHGMGYGHANAVVAFVRSRMHAQIGPRGRVASALNVAHFSRSCSKP